ncbi:MAG: hypothetical protein H5T32_06885 [Candidatus Methanosuratus sp.]|nr:hypothetical protein [Candidatus Methanosuratincola sp.]
MSAILLIAIAIASSAVLWSAFGMPALPQSNVKGELEDIRIVKVTPGEGTVTVYIINRGSTYAAIDSIYFESPYGNLNQSYAINPPVVLGPGELKNVTIDASYSNVVNVKVVTTEGEKSEVLVLDPSSVQSPVTNPVFSSGSSNILPFRITNYDDTIDITNKSVQEIDASFVSTFSSQTIKDYPTEAETNEADALNARLLNSNKNQDTWQYDGPRNPGNELYWSITYGGKVESSSIQTISQLILELVLKIEPKPNTLIISFYDWNSGRYVDSGPGYQLFDIQNTTEQHIIMFLASPSGFINPSTGEYKFAINLTHQDTGGPDNSKIVVQARTVSVISQVPSQQIDPIFYFNLGGIHVSKIASLIFSVSCNFNTSSVPLRFNLYNFTGSTWVQQGDVFFSNETADVTTSFTITVNDNFNHYIKDNELRANLKSSVINGTVYQLDIDEFRLQVLYS